MDHGTGAGPTAYESHDEMGRRTRCRLCCGRRVQLTIQSCDAGSLSEPLVSGVPRQPRRRGLQAGRHLQRLADPGWDSRVRIGFQERQFLGAVFPNSAPIGRKGDQGGLEDDRIWTIRIPRFRRRWKDSCTGLGPEAHTGSNWDHPGDEVGTGFTFAHAGCWNIRVSRSDVAGDLWLEVVG
jgi:hypothetical protein